MKSLLSIRRVEGVSMWPTLSSGDLLLATGLIKPKVGSIVIAKVGDKELVKRVVAVQDKQYQLQGDNLHHSVDSRSFGPVSSKDIQGVVLGFPPSVQGHLRFVGDSL